MRLWTTSPNIPLDVNAHRLRNPIHPRLYFGRRDSGIKNCQPINYRSSGLDGRPLWPRW